MNFHRVSLPSHRFYHRSLRLLSLKLDGAANVVGREAHLPFGEELGVSGQQDKHHFTSYERDSDAGTDYAVNRQYGQGAGRFMRVDPVRGSIGNPQTLNRYAYVTNDPINQTDPLGLIGGPNYCGPGTHPVQGPYGTECVPDDPTTLLPGGGTLFPGDLPIVQPQTPVDTGDVGGPSLEGDDDLRTLGSIVDAAIALIGSNKNCRDLLTGPNGNPLETLKALKEGNKIVTGQTSMARMPDGTLKPAIADWGGTITVGSAFFLGSVGNLIYTNHFGIIDTPVARALVILHEVGHATHAPGSDHGPASNIDWDKLEQYNDAILKTCFGLKPKT